MTIIVIVRTSHSIINTTISIRIHLHGISINLSCIVGILLYFDYIVIAVSIYINPLIPSVRTSISIGVFFYVSCLKKSVPIII